GRKIGNRLERHRQHHDVAERRGVVGRTGRRTRRQPLRRRLQPLAMPVRTATRRWLPPDGGSILPGQTRLRVGASTRYGIGYRGHDMTRPADLVQGTLDLLLRKLLAFQPLYCGPVSERLRQITCDTLQFSDGSLYPALHKLEQQGWIKATWRTSDRGRRAKFDQLTRARVRHRATADA